jgi:hypothetical protein
MRLAPLITSALITSLAILSPAFGQQVQFPQGTSNGLRPIAPTNQLPSSSTGVGPVMVPLNPATQAGIYPAPSGSAMFDPYSTQQAPTYPPAYYSSAPTPYSSPTLVSQNPMPPPGYGVPGSPYSSTPVSGYPGYNGAAPALPGAGPSGVVGTYPYTDPTVYPPSAYPNSAPPALFPGSYPQTGYGYQSGSMYGQPMTIPPPGSVVLPPSSYGNWNPQGTILPAIPTSQTLRCFQGPRVRHTWIYGSNDNDALQINDTDLALAFAIPSFLFSTQPLYLLPSFSLHQWEGPRGSTADLPSKAYSAFLDSGWQSDPTRIFGAELGLRVGTFTDFETSTSDSLRIMGRAIGRMRVTPATTLKAGAIYYDREKTQLLPAGGILWQPNPDTRFDLFFPEPKLAHALSTVGTLDTWWYLAGYYGGGAWTVQRASGAKESVDINDLRVMLGVEWGRNEQIREGRRLGFFEVGYVFQRELYYKESPQDNMDLEDTLMVRAGIGY